MKTISVIDLNERLRNNPATDLIDVRTPAEFGEVHATPAKNQPLDTLKPESVLAGRGGPSDEPIFLICRTGSRAKQACKKFEGAGFDNVFLVEGGTDSWVAAGLPAVHGKKVVSLERQVRIAAGTLVLLGVILGTQVNAHFIWLSAFVGAGLVFAGITDWCGMGLLLAKLPWNRR